MKIVGGAESGDSAVPHLDEMELKEEGYLQEANRVFFFPLGLALCIEQELDGRTRLVVEDHRHDPDGVFFSEEYLRTEEAVRSFHRVKGLMLERVEVRKDIIGGSHLQPVQTLFLGGGA